MEGYGTQDLRNVGFASHGGAGKTSLIEALLFNAGVTDRLGRTDDGTSAMDYDPEEIKRHITIGSSFHHLPWNKAKVNVVDTPGDGNFFFDTLNSLQIVDIVTMLIDATSGIEVQTEKIWKFIQSSKTYPLIFVNKMDKDRADFFKVLDQLKNELNSNIVALQLPIGSESSFQGVIDLIKMKSYLYSDDGKGKLKEEEISRELKEQAENFRIMVETIAESDDALLEKYLEGEELNFEELNQGLQKGIINKLFTPVLCGSALKNIGIQPFLDTIVNSFPSPLKVGPIKGVNPVTEKEEERIPGESEPFSAYVFKTIADPYAGKLTIFRINSGTLNSDSTVYNASAKHVKEKIGQILQPEGKNQKAINPAIAGDIVAVAKLKETTTGNTLTDEKNPIVFSGIKCPSPVISFSLQPKTKGDDEKIATSLPRLIEEDPTLRIDRDRQTKEILLSGMGQIHVEVAIEKLKRKFGVEVQLNTPKVPYKETICSIVKVQGKYKKQSGGRGQYGDTWLVIEPLPRGKGFEFVNKVVGGAIPRQYIPAVEKGIIEVMKEGVLAGYPVVDTKVTLYDGSFHAVDSSEMAFKIAASMGFKKGVVQAKPVLLEPIMSMEVTVPEESMGDVIGDLNSRRGKVLGMNPQDNYQAIKAQVPMSEVLKYSSDLESMTSGRGFFTMEVSHYEEVPAFQSEKIIEAKKVEKESS